MRKIYTTILFLSTLFLNLNAQITFNGCTGILFTQNYVLNNTGTTNDGGTIRNTFESTPSDFAQSCPAGVCELRIIWNTPNSRWEIQLDNDGPLGSPDYTTAVMYYNTTASIPNPPDLSLGTWVDGGFCAGNGTLTLSGDVQSSTLGLGDFDKQSKVNLFPNPSHDFITISGLTQTESYIIYDALGSQLHSGTVSNNENIDLRNLTKGLYFLSLNNGTSMKFIKK